MKPDSYHNPLSDWKVLFLVLAFGAFGGCAADSTRSNSSGNNSGPSSNQEDQVDETDAIVNSATGKFFVDKQDFTLDEIKGGLMPCGGNPSDRVLDDYKIKPWPKKLKAYLSNELVKFPDYSKLGDVFAGFYLSDTTLASDIPEDSGVHVDGLTCQVGANGKYIVFINYKVHVKEREEFGALDEFQENLGLLDRFSLESAPDQTVATMFHELFHVIDFAFFINPSSGKQSEDRKALFDLSWTDYDQPKYDRISILYLDESEPFQIADAVAALKAGWHYHDTRKSLQLAELSPQESANQYKYLGEETNFISPYSFTNVFEDFAASLEVYYVGTRYKDAYPVRTIYSEDITKGLQDKESLYVYDMEKIAKNSKPHRDKLCQMAKTAFKEDCSKYLD